MIEVKDGPRILKFDGTQIGYATSQRRDTLRWIDFKLYKTFEGQNYILSRIGYSKIYHLPDCEIAERSKLDESPREDLDPVNDSPCQECNPHLSNAPFLSFEREKHWARVYATPEEVVEGLMRVDQKSGARYLTAVSRRLLDDASQVDDDLSEVHNIEIIK